MNADMNIAAIESSLSKIRSSFSRLDLGKTMTAEIDEYLRRLSKELDNFKQKASQPITSMADISSLEKSKKNISSLFDLLERDITSLNNTEVKIKLSGDAQKQFTELTKEIRTTQNEIASFKQKASEITQEVKFNGAPLKAQAKRLAELALAGEDVNQVFAEMENSAKDLDKTYSSNSGIVNLRAKISAAEEELKRLLEIQKQAQVAVDNTAVGEEGKRIRAEIESLNKQQKSDSGNVTSRLNKIKKLEGTDNSDADIAKLTEEVAKYRLSIEERRKKIEELKEQLREQNGVAEEAALSEATKNVEDQKKNIEELNKTLDETFRKLGGEDLQALEVFKTKVKELLAATTPEEAQKKLVELQQALGEIKTDAIRQGAIEVDRMGDVSSSAAPAVEGLETAINGVNEQATGLKAASDDVQNLYNRFSNFFTLTNAVNLFTKAVRDAFESVKELDASMTDIAVVTDFNLGDIWDTVPKYTDLANKMSATIQGVYDVSKLYYQQGLDTNEVMKASEETLKMARIAGLEYATATDYMTAALRGFKLEMEDATRVNDIFSRLAAITASDTGEIASALTRTASIAQSAGMDIEQTSAFLTQMIETTRESPENLGTSLKTIIARFQELKKDPSLIEPIDGEMVDANKVETALKTIGVALRDNVTGEFRNLGDVLLEVSSKWDGLSINQQRYISTIAAGSRQQSRFIALMSNYSRLSELVGEAYNSAGASQEQFEKTLDSLQSKLNNLRNAWVEFTTGIANSDAIKWTVDLLTKLLGVINDLTDSTNPFVNTFLKLGVAMAGLKVGGGVLRGVTKKVLPGVANALFTNGQGKKAAKAASGSVQSTAVKDGENFMSSFIKGMDNKVDSINTIKKKISDKFYNFKLSASDMFKGLKSGGGFGSAAAEASVKEFKDAFEKKLQKQNLFKSLSDTIFKTGTSVTANGKGLTGANLAPVVDILKQTTLATENYTDAVLVLENARKLGLSTSNAALLLSDKETLATAKAIIQTAAQTKATKENTAAQLKNIAAKKAASLSSEGSAVQDLTKQAFIEQASKLSKGKNTFNLLFSNNKALREASAAAAGFNKQGAVTSKLIAGIGTKAGAAGPVILGVAAALVAVGVAIAIIAKRERDNSLEEKLKRAAAAVEDAKQKTEEAKQAVEDLQNSAKEYKEIQNNFDELAKGTQAWTKAIIENNQKVVELLSNYKELARYVTKDESGRLIISDEGFQNLEQEYSSRYSAAARRGVYAQINEANLRKQASQKASLEESGTLQDAFDMAAGAYSYALNLSNQKLGEKLVENYDATANAIINYMEDNGTVYDKNQIYSDLDNIKQAFINKEAYFDANTAAIESELDGYYEALMGLEENSVEGFNNIGKYAKELSNKYSEEILRTEKGLHKWSVNRAETIEKIRKQLGITYDEETVTGWDWGGQRNNKRIIDLYAQITDITYDQAKEEWEKGATSQYNIYNTLVEAYQDSLYKTNFDQIASLMENATKDYLKSFIAAAMNPDAVADSTETVSKETAEALLKVNNALLEAGNRNRGIKSQEEYDRFLEDENSLSLGYQYERDSVVEKLAQAYEEIGLSFDDLKEEAAIFEGLTIEEFNKLDNETQTRKIIQYTENGLRKAAKNLNLALQQKVTDFTKNILKGNGEGIAQTANNAGISVQDYIGELVTDLGEDKLTQLNNLFNQIFETLESGTVKASNMTASLANIFKNGTEKDIKAVTKLISSVDDWTSAVEVGAALFEGRNSDNSVVKNLSEEMTALYGAEISAGAQMREFAQSSDGLEKVQEDIQKIVESGKELSDEDLDGIIKSCGMLDDIVKQDIISTNTLKDILSQLSVGEITVGALTDKFLDFCETLYTSNDLLNDVKNNIANFEEGLDATEGVDFWKKQTDAVKEFWEAENYGNPQAINILEKAFGKDYVDSFQGDDIIAAGEEMWKKLNTWTSGEGYGFWEDLANGVFSADGITATIEENGDIILDTANKTTQEIISTLAKGSGASEELIQSFWSVWLAHSPETWAQQKKIDNEAAIKTLQSDKNSFLGQGTNWLFSGEEADAIAKQFGITRDEFISEWKRISSDKPLKIVDWIDSETGVQKTGDQLVNALTDAFGKDINKVSGFDFLSSIGYTPDKNLRGSTRGLEDFVADVDSLSTILENAGINGAQLYEVLNLIGKKSDIRLSKSLTIIDADGAVKQITAVADSYNELQKKISSAQNESDINKFAAGVAAGFEKVFSDNEITITYKNAEGKDAPDMLGKTAMKNVQQGMDAAGPAVIKYKFDNNTVFYNKGKSAGQSWKSGFTDGSNTGSTNNSTTGAKDVFKYGNTETTNASGTPSAPKTEESLVGEIGPELLRRGDKATLVGKKGPEIVKVKKGDQIFPADVTKDILSGTNKTSFAANADGSRGHYSKDQREETSTARKDNLSNSKNNTSSSKKSSKSSSSGSSDKDPYKSALDVYYNFISKLAYLNRKLDQLMDEREEIMDREAEAIDAGDVKSVIAAQNELEEANKTILAQHQQIVQENSDYMAGLKYGLNTLEDRIKSYGDVIDTVNGYMMIHWDSYNNLGDDAKETVDDLISEWKDYYKRAQEAEDAIREIIKYYKDLAKSYRESHKKARDTFLDLIDQLKDALISIDKEALEKMKDYYDQLKKQDQDYLNSLKKNVEERRRLRDRDKSYESLAEKQRKLSLLKRDSSGAYANQIASLQDEINSLQQDLADNEIDNILDKMDEDFEKKVEFYVRQIELMEDSITQQIKNGTYAQKAEDLLRNNPEEAVRLMTEANPDYWSKSEAQREDYLRQINSDMIEMNRYLEGYYLKMAEQMDRIAKDIEVDLINALNRAGEKTNNFNAGAIGSNDGGSGSGSSGSGGGNSGGNTGGTPANNSQKEQIKMLQYMINNLISKYNDKLAKLGAPGAKKSYIAVDGIVGKNTSSMALQMYNWGVKNLGPSNRYVKELIANRSLLGFSQGGLVDFTGPAMVHGSTSKPEAFLSAEDTKNFAMLKDALNRSIKMSNISQMNPNSKAGDCTIYITVDQISNDYDVDRAIEQVQKKILSSSAYRNINLINRTR